MKALCAEDGAPSLQSPPRTAAGANEMDEEQKEWYKQYSASFGVWEFVRFGCFFLFWIFSGLALTSIFNNSAIFVIFFIAIFVFAIIASRWKPAYSLLRKILGNKSLPIEPRPHSIVKIPRQPLPWWGYLFGIWFLLLDLLILYIILKRH